MSNKNNTAQARRRNAKELAKDERMRWKDTERVPIVDADGMPLFGARGEGNNLIAPCACGRVIFFTPHNGWSVNGIDQWKPCDHCPREVLLREERKPTRRFVREVRMRQAK